MKLIKKTHSGQVALVMVLIMTVISAVAVSMASRTTVETRSQQVGSENTDAMLAASTGLEQAVMSGTAVAGTLDNGKNYVVTLTADGGAGVISDKVSSGETLEINLSGASSSITGVKIYFRPATAADVPAIFVSDIRTTKTSDYAFDTLGTNGFTRVSSGGALNGVSFAYVTPEITIVPGSSQTMKITVLGGAAFVGVQPVGGQLPPQSNNFRSVGDVGNGGTTVKYGIEYKESTTNQIPSVFDYALFSNGSIVQ